MNMYPKNTPRLASDISLTVTSVQNRIVTPQHEETFVVGEESWDHIITATRHRDAQVNINGTPSSPPYYFSSNPEVAVIDQTGLARRITNGLSNLEVRTDSGKRSLSRAFPITGGSAGNITAYNGYTVDNSVAKATVNYLENLCQAGDTGEKNLFSTLDHDTSTYVRNTSLYYPYKFSCMGVWNSFAADLRNPTLITPDICIGTHHFSFGNDVTLRFVGEDNTVYNRGITVHASSIWDMDIYKLDSPLPANVIPATILPSNWKNYLYGVRWNEVTMGLTPDLFDSGPGIVYIHKDNELYTARQANTSGSGNGFDIPRDEATARYDFHNPLAYNVSDFSGNSGRPMFMTWENMPILLGYWTGVMGAVSIFKAFDDILNLIDSAGGDATFNYADFTGYQTYDPTEPVIPEE